MKKLSALVLGLFLPALLSAQSVSYKTTLDDPYDIKNLCISLDPFYGEFWGTNSGLGFGVRADLYFRKILTFNFDLRRAYMDLNAVEHADASLPQPLDDLKKLLYLDAGGQFSFLDRSKDRDLKVVLSSSSSSSGRYTTTHTKYIKVPGTLRKIKQLRFGLMTMRSAIDISDGTNDGSNFKAQGTVNPTDTFSFGSFGRTVDGSATYSGYTMMFYSAVYAGLGAKRITNLQVETDLGKKSNALCTDWYLDVVYAPILTFADVFTTGGKQWTISNEDITRIGWRFGVAVRSSSRSYLSYRTEFGSRPGFKGGEGILNANFYLMFTAGWTIPFKIPGFNSKG